MNVTFSSLLKYVGSSYTQPPKLRRSQATLISANKQTANEPLRGHRICQKLSRQLDILESRLETRLESAVAAGIGCWQGDLDGQCPFGSSAVESVLVDLVNVILSHWLPAREAGAAVLLL